MGLKLTKYHQCLHVPHLLRQFGSGTNFHGGPGEEHHKAHCKAPAKNTQRNVSNFTAQCGRCFVESLAIDGAAKYYLQEEDNQNQVIEEAATGLKLMLWREQRDDGNWQCFYQWQGGKICRLGMPPDALRFVLKELELQIVDDKVFGFTEYKRNGTIFRSHPLYMNNKPWHDWAVFHWAIGNVEEDHPAKILCFLDLTDITYEEGDHYEPDYYALIQTTGRVIEESAMLLNFANKIMLDCARERPQWSKEIEGVSYPYQIVPVDSIVDTIAVVEDVGNDPGHYLVLTPEDMWADSFGWYIERVHERVQMQNT